MLLTNTKTDMRKTETSYLKPELLLTETFPEKILCLSGAENEGFSLEGESYEPESWLE